MSWRSEAYGAIRRYPQHKRDSEQLRAVSITASANGGRGGTSVSRTTENAALRELPRQAQRELDAVREAIATTRQYRNGEHHVRLIELMYWRGRSNMSMIIAANEIPIALITARTWHNDFVKLVDAYLRIF